MSYRIEQHTECAQDAHNPLWNVPIRGNPCTTRYFWTRFPPESPQERPLPNGLKMRRPKLPCLKNCCKLPSLQIRHHAKCESHERRWSPPQMSTLNNTCPSFC